jgi:antitoxin MazE
MRATVKKWGNSAAVRIPASVMEATRLHLDEDVDVREEKGRIVIEPVRQKRYRLEDLVKQINARNLPEPVDFGPPVGREVW